MGIIKDILGNKVSLGASSKYGKYQYTGYPRILLKHGITNIEDLVDEMKPVLDTLSSLANEHDIDFVITSGKDSTEHKPNSYHYVGRAVDISVRKGYTDGRISGWSDKGDIFQEFKKMLNPEGPRTTDFDILYETNPDHVHVEYDPKKKSENQKTSTIEQPSTKTTGVTVSQEVSSQKPIAYFHTDPTIKSVSELIAQNVLFKDVNEQEFLQTKQPGGITNEEAIKNSYNNPDDENKVEEWPLLKPGTLLFVMPKDLNLDTLAVESVGQVKEFQNWGEYQTETQKFLNNLPGYCPAYWDKLKDYDYRIPVKYVNSAFRVWVFCKAVNHVLDLTSYCYGIQTSTNVQGGDSFSLDLAFVHSSLDFEQSTNPGKVYKQEVLRANAFKEKKISKFAREISENDIVFLSFEQLDCEKRNWVEGSVEMVELSELANQYYDFIGLVSGVQQTADANGIGRVVVTGESVSKLFNIDEAIFRPIAAIQNSFSGNIVIGDKKKRGWMERMFVDGQYHALWAEEFRTIERTMKYYLNLVSNVGLLPLNDVGEENTDLFESWGDERTKVYKIETDEKGNTKEIQEGLAKGIYQIIKLQVQPELANRHLSDGSIFNPEGTIYSLMKNVCQEPLVELITDTYKNTFDIICRVPPFSKKALVEWSETLRVEAKNSSYFGDIEVEDVLNEELAWETNVYTWFELEPKGTVIPVDEQVSFCYIPTLFLNDFIEVWGSRSLSISSPYSVIGSTDKENKDEIRQALQDLCWMVETHFYLPFTRRGTITLAVPDRRIKKGQWIRYKKTGELFYVEGVEQTADISSSMVTRTTTLTVSRGLLEKYIDPKVGKGYFDIIDFDALKEQLSGFSKKSTTTGEGAMSGTTLSAIINKKVFRFFASKSQFIYEPEDWKNFE